jgi:hypothetical protein
MNRLCISFLAASLLAFTAGAQSAEQQARKNPPSQQGQRSASSANQGQQSGTQGSAAVSASSSASASANAGPASAGLSSGTMVNADLVTALDARKVHPGQRVVARTTRDVKSDGHVILKRGTRLIGHVTEAQAKTKAQAQSSLGIVFDEAISKKGEAIPFHAAIQALAESQSAASLANDDLMSSGDAMGSAGAMGSTGSRGGLLGGGGSAVGSTAGMAGGAVGGLRQTAGGTLRTTSSVASSAAGSVGGLDAAGELTSNSSGVFGLRGLNLDTSASNATEGSVITSSLGSVHLSSGTQMLLRVTGQ